MKIIYTLIILGLLGGLVFAYITRPVKTPTLTESEKQANLNLDTNTEGESLTVYSIDQSRSNAEFNIYEDLNGKPFTVVGTTSSVFGEFTLNIKNPEQSILGTIKIDARTLKTDSSKRDGAIARIILKSEEPQNNFIVFKPTSIMAIPADAQKGAEYSFKVIGLLTISGVEREVVFDTKAQMNMEGEIVGLAVTEVKRSDFGIKVPSLSFIANVADSVPLKFSFTLVEN